MLSHGKRGSRHKLKHRRIFLNIRKYHFTVRVVEHWHRLSRESVESPSMAIFQSHLATVLGNHLWDRLTSGGHFIESPPSCEPCFCLFFTLFILQQGVILHLPFILCNFFLFYLLRKKRGRNHLDRRKARVQRKIRVHQKVIHSLKSCK